MAAYVYIWNKRYFSGEVGHLSLELSDETYISHWPSKQKGLGAVSSHKMTYDEDVEAEGRDPSNTLKLPKGMLDEGKIRRWWRKYQGDYTLLGNNCAKVVYRALEKGGIKQYARFMTSLMTEEIVLTPADVYEFVRQCKTVYEDGAFMGSVKNVMMPFKWGWWK